jgi:hypothetical protein
MEHRLRHANSQTAWNVINLFSFIRKLTQVRQEHAQPNQLKKKRKRKKERKKERGEAKEANKLENVRLSIPICLKT